MGLRRFFTKNSVTRHFYQPFQSLLYKGIVQIPIQSNTVKRVTLLLFDFRPARDQNFQTVHP